MARSALENCSHVNSLIYSVPIQIANLTQLFLSVATMISVFYGLYSANQTAKQARRIQAYRIQFSLWIIFLIALLLYFLLSLQITVLKTYGFIQLMFNRNPCAFLWTKQTCILIKFPISASIIGFNLLAVIVLFERVIGTYFIKLYSRYGKFLGLTLTVLTLLINFVILYYMYKDQEIRGPPSYCITTLLTSQRKVSNVMSLFVFFNIATMFGVVLLFFTSRRQMDRRDVDYKLSKSLELNENYVSNQLVLPSDHNALLLISWSTHQHFYGLKQLFKDWIAFKTSLSLNGSIRLLFSITIDLKHLMFS
ncbi:hypothetical protein M3Y97_00195200 [Aphelenchoides bicaudatus]|nr:hypothetical protein M3Y97_00195200 [Aphelenchoides bicaudatus]